MTDVWRVACARGLDLQRCFVKGVAGNVPIIGTKRYHRDSLELSRTFPFAPEAGPSTMSMWYEHGARYSTGFRDAGLCCSLGEVFGDVLEHGRDRS